MRVKLGIGLMLLSGLFLPHMAMALELPSWDAPIPVVSEVMVQGEDIRTGLDFHATLSEAVTYQGMTLPEGTQFVGRLENANSHRSWFRQHHADLWITEAVFPNGERYAVYRGQQVQPHYHFKSTLWSGHPQNRIDIGERLELRFTPAVLKGMMQTGMIRQPHPLD